MINATETIPHATLQNPKKNLSDLMGNLVNKEVSQSLEIIHLKTQLAEREKYIAVKEEECRLAHELIKQLKKK